MSDLSSDHRGLSLAAASRRPRLGRCHRAALAALLGLMPLAQCWAGAQTLSSTATDFGFESDSPYAPPQGFDVAGSVAVSASRARSGAQSVSFTRGASDVGVYLRKDFAASGSGRIKLSVYVPSAATANTYLSLFQDSYSADPDRVLELALQPDGQLRNRTPGGVAIAGAYALDAWNDVEILWDGIASDGRYTLLLNGKLVGRLPVAQSGKLPARFEVKYGANDLGGGTASIYVDNVAIRDAVGFDPVHWKITLPDGTERGTAWLADGNTNSAFYYKGDGSLVFRCPNIAGTTANSHYSRSELREMIGGADPDVQDRGFTANNWVLSTSSGSIKSLMGGIDGDLRATLKVDHVSTTGDAYKIGRLIIGQIHASENEPLRLYYRKLPGNGKGAIYFAHQIPGGSDTWYEMIGSRADNAGDPADGIALGEPFSYAVKARGRQLTVTVSRPGKPDVAKTITMDAGYNDDWMYFKAGVYNQNNSGSSSDYAQATFYSVTASHPEP